jgi:hypothetical protein
VFLVCELACVCASFCLGLCLCEYVSWVCEV